MKKLMLTTAMCTGLAFAAAAQTAETDMDDHSAAGDMVPAFLASDFTGKTVYTLDSEDARAVGAEAGGMSAGERQRLRWTSSETFTAERDDWESVGSIDDIVMTQDGEIRGILIDVGGFLGFGARTVMLGLDELFFVSEEGHPEEVADFSVVVAMTEEELENLPEWDEDQLRAGFETRAPEQDDQAFGDGGTEETDTAGMTEGDAMTSEDREVFSEDHQMLEGEERTADRLMGADVYDAEGENIGSVDDIVFGSDDGIDGILVDVGGFLGIGAHTVMLPVDDAQIGWNDEDGDVRVQVSMTADQLEDMPEYEG